MHGNENNKSYKIYYFIFYKIYYSALNKIGLQDQVDFNPEMVGSK
jgi:hypothetical protein